ncbi:CDC27 family protein [Bacillus mexicanus]|uniref:tetratricopeptide repeat protein n=1 Tax=Bacillus mexicanus TaxID=2834415 RepID=UPI003D22248C
MKKIFKLYPDNFYVVRANEAFEKGMDEIANTNYKKAYSCFRDAIELNPNESKYYFFAGLSTYYFQEELSTGLFGKAAMMDIENVDYQMWYGISLYRDKKFPEAKKVLVYAFSLDPKNEKVAHYLMKTFNRMGEYKNVKDILDNKIGRENATSEMFYELGYSYMKEVEYSKAKKMLKSSIESDPKNIMSYYFLSRVYCKLGEFDDAIDILNCLAEKVESEKDLVKSHIEGIEMLRSF